MRAFTLAVLTTVTVLTTAPAVAQRYAGGSPFCFQSYGRGGTSRIECTYVSIEQCKATASGLSASCFANPSFASAQSPRDPTDRTGPPVTPA